MLGGVTRLQAALGIVGSPWTAIGTGRPSSPTGGMTPGGAHRVYAGQPAVVLVTAVKTASTRATANFGSPEKAAPSRGHGRNDVASVYRGRRPSVLRRSLFREVKEGLRLS